MKARLEEIYNELGLPQNSLTNLSLHVRKTCLIVKFLREEELVGIAEIAHQMETSCAIIIKLYRESLRLCSTEDEFIYEYKDLVNAMEANQEDPTAIHVSILQYPHKYDPFKEHMSRIELSPGKEASVHYSLGGTLLFEFKHGPAAKRFCLNAEKAIYEIADQIGFHKAETQKEDKS